MMIISEQNIFLNQVQNTKMSILQDIAAKATTLGIANSAEHVLEALMQREEELSTYLDMDIAIPHAKAECIHHVSIIFYRTSESISWDEENVCNIFIVFLVPLNNIDNTHLKLLTAVSRKLANKSFLQKIRHSNDIQGIYAEFQKAINHIHSV